MIMKNNRKNFNQLHKDLVTRLLEGDGTASHSMRKSAFDNSISSEPLKKLIDKICFHSYSITDRDFDEMKEAGLNENQLFELVICAAVGQASRQYNNALAALAEAVDNKRSGHAS